jgi:protein-disulfide isomerase
VHKKIKNVVHQNQRFATAHNFLESSKDPKKNQIETQRKHPAKLWHNMSRKTATTLKKTSINYVPVGRNRG